MKKMIFLLVVSAVLSGGCGNLRFAPSEQIKQNAWLHEKTARMAKQTAVKENSSEKLKELTELSHVQSIPFVSYCGLPDEMPDTSGFDEITSTENETITKKARANSIQRPDVFDVTNTAMDIGLGIAAILGGVYGTRIARFIKSARQKTTALKEIIEGNEIFKFQNPDAAGKFKNAQQLQSPSTRRIVSEMKT